MNKQHTHGRANFASISDVMLWRVWKLRTLARKHFSIRLPLSIIRVKKEPASWFMPLITACDVKFDTKEKKEKKKRGKIIYR